MCASALTTVSTCATPRVDLQSSTIHVDDMAAAASNKAEMAKLKEQLRSFFGLVDLSELKWLLGVAVTRNRCTRPYLYLKPHILQSIANVHTSKTRIQLLTPLIHMSFFERPWSQRRRGKTTDEENPVPHHNWLHHVCCTVTRPDVSYAVQHLQPVQFNLVILIDCGTTVIRYLYATRDRSLVLSWTRIRLTGWVDL